MTCNSCKSDTATSYLGQCEGCYAESLFSKKLHPNELGRDRLLCKHCRGEGPRCNRCELVARYAGRKPRQLTLL
jgi:predicted SprT family Zn-dependent metalloprotease